MDSCSYDDVPSDRDEDEHKTAKRIITSSEPHSCSTRLLKPIDVSVLLSPAQRRKLIIKRVAQFAFILFFYILAVIFCNVFPESAYLPAGALDFYKANYSIIL